MNKTAIKNFAIWSRNKLIADITYKAGLLGITENGIKNALPQSTKGVHFFDIGTKEPYSISGIEIKQREKLVETINNKAKQSDYLTAYKAVIEEVAYTWFNRLIAVRFMEVNDYLPSRIRVLSSESATKIEPDLVTTPFDTDLDFSPYEKDRIVQLTHDNHLDELFQMLFIKQCNALNAILPNLFEKTNDYTELLLNVSFTDKDGVVYHLVHDIPEIDFRIRTEADEEAIRTGKMTEEEAPRGQVEIIGWLYQYYNTEPKDEAFALLKKNVKITKERIPAATQLFTPDWIVRYMVENSLGRLWINVLESSFGYTYSSEYALRDASGHRTIDKLKSNWKYYIEEAEQTEDVEFQLEKVLESYRGMKPEDIKVIDPCMGSGHILVYAFDVLMQIYESCGYSQREAARNILVHNIYGLDIDNRAYQLAYFALMMKARQYNRRILDGEIDCHVYSIQESNGINRAHLKYFGSKMSEIERNIALLQLNDLLDTFFDAKEYGSILNVENYNWELLYRFLDSVEVSGQLSLDAIGIEDTKEQLCILTGIGIVMAQKYDVVVTNPPYMGNGGMSGKLSEFVKMHFPDSKSDLFAVLMEKCQKMTKKSYYQAMITQHSWMFLSSFEKFRKKLQSVDIINMAHLGARAFEEISGEVVQTTAFVIRNSNIYNYKATYARLVDYNNQQTKEETFITKKEFYYSSKENFIKVPGIPFAYWISKKQYDIFANDSIEKLTISDGQNITGNNELFLRYWWEVSSSLIGSKWVLCARGGAYRKWYGNIEEIIDWSEKARLHYRSDKIARIVPEYIRFKKGISWSRIASSNVGFRLLSQKELFEKTGVSIFVNDDSKYNQILALLNSCVTKLLLSTITQVITIQVRDVRSIPYIDEIDKYNKPIGEIVENCIRISKMDWDSFETSWDFGKNPLLLYKNRCLIADTFAEWNSFTENHFNQLKTNEEKLNFIFIDIYGLQNELSPEVADKDVTIHKADLERDIRSFISYAVGCMFGRYSLDIEGLAYAGGQWDDRKYSTFMPDKDNILPITDEEYFQDDIVGLFIAFVKKVYGEETLEQNLDFIAKALGNKGNTSREIIRNYFVKDFFKDHCKIYQKRPIYWLFDSGKSDGFKALIYMHRYDENTIGNLRIDYLHKMQRVYESEIARMQDTIENSTNAREVTAAEKRKEKLTKQLKETKEYDAKIAHLALARIVIDLDDGVAVNYEKVQTDIEGKKLEVLVKI